jgi:HSP20 family molecular chaperone IbpA
MPSYERFPSQFERTPSYERLGSQYERNYPEGMTGPGMTGPGMTGTGPTMTGEYRPYGFSERRPIETPLEQKEWVPLWDRKLVQAPALDMPEVTRRFPTEPEDYFPGWRQEYTYSPEDEWELVHRVGVKSGIHLQALTRDLNRLASLVEGPSLSPNKRDNLYALVDVLDEMDRMDFNIKKLLSNLHKDLRDRSAKLKDLILQEEDDGVREEEALRKRKSGILQQPVVPPQVPLEVPMPSQVPTEPVTPPVTPSVTKTEQPPLWEEKEIHKTIRHFGRPEEHLKEKKKPILEKPSVEKPILEKSEPLESRVEPVGVTSAETPVTTRPVTGTQTIPISDKPFFGKTTGPTTPLERQGTMETRGEKFHPFFDIQENPDNLTLISFIPGMRKEDIKLDFGLDSFTIEGNAIASAEQETGKYGSFLETYKLPTAVNPNEVRASYHGGQLQIICPKETVKQSAF